MNSKTKLSILFLSIISLSFLIFFRILMEGYDYLVEPLNYAKIAFGIGFVTFLLYLFIKKWRNTLTKVMLTAFGICLCLNLYQSVETYQHLQHNKRLEIYKELSCKEMKSQFESDFKNDKIVYFMSGLGYNEERSNILREYDVNSYYLGCIMGSNLRCYNDIVKDYLKEKHDYDLDDH